MSYRRLSATLEESETVRRSTVHPIAANPATTMMRAFERDNEQRTTRAPRRKPRGSRSRMTRRRTSDPA